MSAIEAYLEAAELAYANDDLVRARDCYLRVLEQLPGHALAGRALAELDAQLGEELPSGAIVMLAVPLAELVRRHVPGRDAFILSRLATGPLSVSDLSAKSGTTPEALRAMLPGWMSLGLVCVT